MGIPGKQNVVFDVVVSLNVNNKKLGHDVLFLKKVLYFLYAYMAVVMEDDGVLLRYSCFLL